MKYRRSSPSRSLKVCRTTSVGSMSRPNPNSDTFEVLFQGSRNLGIELNRTAITQMIRHVTLVSEWGTRVNLTSMGTIGEMVIFHLLDSLTLFKVVPMGCPMTVLDLGTGAGFPGLVVRIADPSKQVTLLDRSAKKIVFLKHVAKDLGLGGIRFQNSTLDAVILDSGVSKFDLIVSRAFSSDPLLPDRICDLLKPGGLVVRMAGPSSKLDEPQLAYYAQSDIWEGTLPSSSSFRRVIAYRRNY
ncbi:16S rRNA (guanine(527)-N(7))-methyltransferase RsmG [Thermodesulfobacteriota bacterium]